MKGQTMADQIIRFWDKNAGRYDDSESKSAAVNQEILARTIKHLAPDDTVLDFGCATGTKAIELSKKVKFMHGLDLSPEMIKLANKKKEALSIPNISFSSGTIFSDAFKPESFDAIVSYAVIHLLEDKDEVVRRIHELLKPKGLFISVTACLKEKKSLLKSTEIKTYLLLQKLGAFPLHLNMLTGKDVEDLLIRNHFKVIETKMMFDGISACFIVAEKLKQVSR